MYNSLKLPCSVDLRSKIDSVYSQSTTPACGAHAVINSIEIVYDNAWVESRFSRAFVWWYTRFYQGLEGQNVGSTFESLKLALETRGVCYEHDCPWYSYNEKPKESANSKSIKGFKLERFNLGVDKSDTVSKMKYTLACGFPIIFRFQTNQSVSYLGNDWRKHNIDLSQSPIGSHYVVIVGYDDTCQRFLLENSWGSSYADAGFFGIEYKDILDPRLFEELLIISSLPIEPKPCQGFAMPTAFILTQDKVNQFDRLQDKLKSIIQYEVETKGLNSAIQLCKEWKLSDKTIEAMFSLQRGTIRNIKQSNPDNIDWVGFLFEQP